MTKKNIKLGVLRLICMFTSITLCLLLIYFFVTKYFHIKIQVTISLTILILEIVVPATIYTSLPLLQNRHIVFGSVAEWLKTILSKKYAPNFIKPSLHLFFAALIGGIACTPEILFNYPYIAVLLHLITLALSIHAARSLYSIFLKPTNDAN